MRVPNAEDARVDPEKLKAYLLSETHPVGRAKATFFRSLGFDESNRAVLERGLIAIIKTQEIAETIASPYGRKYVVEGMITTPSGTLVKLRTVWIVEQAQTIPRLVTAYPM